jgi:predicted site-specific integrase-resolvase
MLSTREVAEILNVNERTARRYKESGLLSSCNNHVPKKAVLFLKSAMESYDSIKNIKEFFVLSKEGADLENIIQGANHFKHLANNIQKKQINAALYLYSWKRDNYLRQFAVDPESIFLVEEAAERLRITDKHVIYDLINSNELKAQTALNSRNKKKERYFVAVDSFFDYLGKDKGIRFYTSKDASLNLDISVNKIDKIALKNKIGRKIKAENKNSIYLFSLSDVFLLGSKKVNHCDSQSCDYELQ